MLHVLEARGNANHGASYALQYRDMFDNGGPLERHLYFQWALYLLDLGRYDRILKFLEVNIFPQRVSQPHAAQTLADATQLFWRLHFVGQETEELREQLYDAWAAVAEDEKDQRVVLSPFTRLLCHVRREPHALAELGYADDVCVRAEHPVVVRRAAVEDPAVTGGADRPPAACDEAQRSHSDPVQLRAVFR